MEKQQLTKTSIEYLAKGRQFKTSPNDCYTYTIIYKNINNVICTSPNSETRFDFPTQTTVYSLPFIF